MALGKTFKSAVLAGLLAAMPLTQTFADNAGTPSTRPVAAQTVSYSQDAMLEATRWSKQHLDGAGIAVRLGTQHEVTPERIEEVLKREFKASGVTNIAFFYQENNTPATGFTLHADGATYGVYTVLNVKQNVPKVAEQIKLLQNPAFAAN